MHLLSVYKHKDKPLGELPQAVVRNPMPVSGELINLVPILRKRKDGDRILEEIGRVTVEEFNDDRNGRKRWERRMSRSLKKFNSYNESKNYPFPNSSNVVLPFLSIAVLQYYARALSALITPSGVARALPINEPDRMSAARVTKHLNYQFNYEIPNYFWESAKMMIAQALYGSAFRKTWFDPFNMRVESRYVSPFNLVFPNDYKCFEQLPRVSHFYRLTEGEVQMRLKSGIFDGEVWTPDGYRYGDGYEGEEERSYKQMMGLITDQVVPGGVVETHTWWDLNGDKVEEPYIVTVDYNSRKVVRIVDRLWLDHWQRAQVLDFFTHYCFVPHPEGILGIGFETLLGQLSSAAGTIINEMIDAGHLSNTQGGFMMAGTRFRQRGDQFMERGLYKEIDADTDDIRKAIYNLDFKEPSNALFNLLGLLFDYSQNVVSATQSALGQSPKSDTPNMANLMAMEETRMLLGVIHKGNLESLKQECLKVFRCNSMFLSDDRYVPIVGNSGELTTEHFSIGKMDYMSIASVVPAAPGNLNYRIEEMVRAKELFGLVMQSPMAQSQEALQLSLGKLLRSYDLPEQEVQVMVQAMIQALQPPQPPDLPPYLENAAFLRAEFPQVLPHQNHEQHLMEHEMFLQGDNKEDLNPEGMANLLRHQAHHRAEAYRVRIEEGLKPGEMMGMSAPEESALVGGNGSGQQM